MAKMQIGPVFVNTWNTPATIVTGGANGTVIDNLLVNNSSDTSTGVITTKINIYVVPSGQTANEQNQTLTQKSLFRRRNYQLSEMEGFFLETGTELQVEAYIADVTGVPSLVFAGSYEDL